MSFSFCPFYKLLLNDDIKDKIMKKINDIKAHSDWCKFDLCINNEDLNLSTLNCDDIRHQRNLWYNIAKLSIDLWINYDFYQTFTFESKFDDKDYRERLENLGYVYKSEKWESVSRPSKDVVLTNVFIYCLHQLMFKEMVDSDVICVFCDQKRQRDSFGCNCGASFEEINYLQTKIKESEKVSGKKESITEKVGESCSSSEKGVDITPKKNKKNNSLLMKKEKKKMRLAKGESEKKGKKCGEKKTVGVSDKWKCGKCELFNGYSLINCAACGELYGNGWWTCGQCTMENACSIEECVTCEMRNVNVEVVKPVVSLRPVVSEPETSNYQILDGNWKCGKCGSQQSYGVSSCSSCDESRSSNGQWSCSVCTFINKCSIERCQTCNSWNKYLLVKYCQYCKLHRLTAENSNGCTECSKNDTNRNGRWQCWYDNCRWVNKSIDEYCVRCRLWRHNSQKRGDRVKQSFQNQVRHVWICHKCCTINDLSRTTCSKFFCRETRYRKVYCFKCDLLNNGVTNHCEKCNVRLR